MRVWGVIACCAVAAVANLVTFIVTRGWPHLAVVAALGAVIAAHLNLNRIERKRHGRHRQAEEDSRDPDEGTSEDTGSAVGGSVGGTYTISGSGLSNQILASGSFTRVTFGGSTKVDEVEVERVQSEMPILAHRLATVAFDGMSKPFRSLNEAIPFGVDANATCRGFGSGLIYAYGSQRPTKGHAAPHVNCACGFYALPSDVEPWAEGCGYVTLLVELSGTVIEHERGYRAGHQRVIECQLEPCPLCRRPAEVVNVKDDNEFDDATCLAHAKPGARQVSVDDLRSILGVPVTHRSAS